MGLCTKEWEIKEKRTATFSVSARRWRFCARKTRRTPIPRLASQECSVSGQKENAMSWGRTGLALHPSTQRADNVP